MKRKLVIPEGTIDYLPQEAYKRRQMINLLLSEVDSWGYEEVKTPLIENFNVIRKKTDEAANFFALVDTTGEVLTLRPEFTAPIARLVGAHMKNSVPLPIRLSYTGDVFEQTGLKEGKKRQSTQVGVELIGSSTLKSDCEILVMALECLFRGEVQDCSLGIGHMAITQGLLKGLQEDDRMAVRQLMIKKDMVALKSLLVDKVGEEKSQGIMTIATQNGGIDFIESIKNYSEEASYQEAIGRLVEIYRLFESLGYSERIFFDFSILGDFDYYSGIVLEGYGDRIGSPIITGGRYDNLLEEYGLDTPAIGFAINLDLYMKGTLYGFSEKEAPVVLETESFLEDFKESRLLRENGKRITLSLEE